MQQSLQRRAIAIAEARVEEYDEEQCVRVLVA
jgi:hypothetical protein